jgi:diguanylate cyclase (GGDEF)-like protein/putative nucleotidyltransferase with HDIG domain
MPVATDHAPEGVLAAAIDSLGELPVLSGTVVQISELADDPESTTAELVTVLEADESFSANLLRFANSAHNARPVRASTIRQAVTFVGRSALKRLALEAGTYRFLEQVPGNGSPSRGQMHIHAVAVASCAVGFAARAGISGDVAHLAGLLHDVGKLVMPIAFGEDVLDEIARGTPSGTARIAAERARTGLDHAFAGEMLARRWGLPHEVADVIAVHHGGTSGCEVPSRDAACVQLANQVVTMVDGSSSDLDLIEAALAALDLTPEALDEVAEVALSAAATSSGILLAERVGQLYELARIDDLTGVLNRRAWLQHVREALGVPGCVLVCDIDHFKVVNDRYGHRTGDLLLSEVARVLDRQGTAGRLGGDEFGLWVAGDLAAGHAAAENILESIRASLSDVPGLDGVGVSIGLAHAEPHELDVMDLVERADAELYRVKETSRRPSP